MPANQGSRPDGSLRDIRATKEEWNAWRAAAAAKGIQVSDWLRKIANRQALASTAKKPARKK